jgi:CheY-like chemotaxis protein
MDPPISGVILVIDDDPSIVRALTRLLRREGYLVETAGNGREAFAHLRGQSYAVILSDLQMPECDGGAFYARLRQHDPALCQRVIFLTGAGDAESRTFLARCGRPWLRKPFSLAALRRAIQQVLEAATTEPTAHLCVNRHS